MLSIAVALAAQAISTVTEAPWLVERHERMCAMSARFRDRSIIRFEYRPLYDDYLMLLSGGPYNYAVDEQHYRVRIEAGPYFYETGGKGVIHPEKLGTIYIPMSDTKARQRPKLERFRLTALEYILLSKKPVKIAVDGRQTAVVDFGNSPLALDALATCTDKIAWKSPLVNRLQKSRGLR